MLDLILYTSLLISMPKKKAARKPENNTAVPRMVTVFITYFCCVCKMK